MIKIPLFQSVSSNFTQTIELEDQLVTIKIVYNIRIGSFFLTFTAGDVTLYGIKIVQNWPLLRQSKAFLSSVFAGDFLAKRDVEIIDEDITYDNFGNGWNLYYITSEELTEWEDSNGI